MAIRVLLVDDHAMMRAGIRALLAHATDIEIVGEADEGRTGLAMAESLHPDVVLMDLAMPGMNGIEALAVLHKSAPRARAIVLSMHADADRVSRALKAGAAGYLLKLSEPSELQAAIRAVARGETYLTPAISRTLADTVTGRVVPGEPLLDRLTPREREVLQLVAEGKSSKEIGTLLHLSTKTVEAHRANLMRTLDIHDVAGLVRFAVRSGLVDSH